MGRYDNVSVAAERLPLRASIASRLQGPGGYYNMGNLLGLVAGTAVQIIHAAEVGPIGPLQSARITLAQFGGSSEAVFLSLAMLVFFWSGEVYHRAWTRGFPPDERLNRRGDWLSGFGAIALGTGLMITGQPFLAATAGLLHAIGKFGSALSVPGAVASWPAAWPDLWRSLVLASRVPALLAAAISLATAFATGPVGADLITPATLIACCLLWIKADLMLFGGKS